MCVFHECVLCEKGGTGVGSGESRGMCFASDNCSLPMTALIKKEMKWCDKMDEPLFSLAPPSG